LPSPEDQAETKQAFVSSLGAEQVVAIGNGRNDGPMLKAAALGIALVQLEGGAVETLVSADIVFTSILDALDLLSHPKRLVATLRA
jgi:soluble P-type ATPase